MKYIIIPIFRILSLPFLAIALIGLLIITFLYFLFWELNIKRFTSFWRKETFNSNKIFLSNATWYDDFLSVNEEEVYVSYYKTFWDYLFYRKKYTIYKGKETIYE